MQCHPVGGSLARQYVGQTKNVIRSLAICEGLGIEASQTATTVQGLAGVSQILSLPRPQPLSLSPRDSYLVPLRHHPVFPFFPGVDLTFNLRLSRVKSISEGYCPNQPPERLSLTPARA